MFLGETAHLLHFAAARLDPPGRPKNTMILLPKCVAGFNVVMKQSAVIDHASDDFDIVFFRSRQAKVPAPWFERIEDDHCPIDERAEAFETMNEVEREAISWPRRNADALCQTRIFQ